ncbi:helix-turn-helix domain-containing protein [Thomasclavelia cocleata]|mgnify:CR=1 FL=1|uniref:helix-turn-helix domain-containing protein n=1 Tax=Thomasclavelia cocleata TaxID=69824 RepID=UPI00272D2999|nr:helix-turn-helix domain-containing protein [Thomasclavelia cocleata]
MFAKMIKHQLVDKDLKVSDLARLLNTSDQNISQKLKRDNFSEKEMTDIARALNLTLKITLE